MNFLIRFPQNPLFINIRLLLPVNMLIIIYLNAIQSILGLWTTIKNYRKATNFCGLSVMV